MAVESAPQLRHTPAVRSPMPSKLAATTPASQMRRQLRQQQQEFAARRRFPRQLAKHRRPRFQALRDPESETGPPFAGVMTRSERQRQEQRASQLKRYARSVAPARGLAFPVHPRGSQAIPENREIHSYLTRSPSLKNAINHR